MKFKLQAARKIALLEQLSSESQWGGLITFMDTIDSLAELKALEPHFRRRADPSDLHLIDYYRDKLTRWQNPVMEEEFRARFPLVASRLIEPWQIRVFLRAVHSRKVNQETMAEVFEELIYRHEVLGEQYLWYPNFRDGEFGRALRIVYHTELPYWTLKRLMFYLDPPQCSGCFYSSEATGMYVDWRPKHERDGKEFPFLRQRLRA